MKAFFFLFCKQNKAWTIRSRVPEICCSLVFLLFFQFFLEALLLYLEGATFSMVTSPFVKASYIYENSHKMEAVVYLLAKIITLNQK